MKQRIVPIDLTAEDFRRLVSSIVDYAIFMLDPQGYVASWNPGSHRIKGYSADEIIGQHFSKFYSREDVEAGKPERELEEARRDGRIEDEGWRVRKDGSRFWANVVITALYDDIGTLRGFAKITRDLSERKQAEEQLRASEERFRLLVAHVVDYAIFALDIDGNVTSWNDGAHRIKGYEAHEIIGQHFSRFYPTEDIESGKPQRNLETARQEGRTEDEGWRIRKDGSRFWANVVITPLRDEQGRLLGFTKVTRDLTDRRRTEQFREQFIANAAHEIRTPLGTIKGFADALTRQDELSPESVHQATAALNRGVDRLARLVNNLLDLTRLEQASLRLTPQRIKVAAAVRDALESAPAPATTTVAIHGDAEVFVDPGRFVQAITNLLTNTYRYGGHNAQIEIAVNADNVDIAVTDDGPGVPRELETRIFEPFVRGDHGTGHGSGLGLSITRALIDAMGGELRYERGRADGARFVISLPRA